MDQPLANPSPPRLGALRRAATVLALALALFSTTLLSFAAAQGVTLSDDLGREVVLAAPPTRIVSLAPSHSESVCAVASCDLLVGVDTNTDFPAELAELPRVGNAFTPDIEAIVALEPDLVLADEYSGVHEALERLGLTVYAGTPQTVDETLDFLATLGEMLGESERATELIAAIEADFDEVAAALSGADAPTVFIELDPTPYSVGPGSFLGTLLARAGGENIVTSEMGDFPQVAPEFVVASDPEVVIMTDAPFGETAASLAARPGWANIAAVTDDRVLELSTAQVNVLTRAGPRLGEAVLLLAHLLHPDLVDASSLSPELVGP